MMLTQLNLTKPTLEFLQSDLVQNRKIKNTDENFSASLKFDFISSSPQVCFYITAVEERDKKLSVFLWRFITAKVL